MIAADLSLDYLPVLPDDKSPGIGCVGAGFIMSDCQLVAYRNAGFNPVAITSRIREVSESVAKRHSIGKVYDSCQEMFADPEVTVADIAVPPDQQLEVIRQAVKHPNIKAILAQKPMGMNYAEALEIVRLCEDAGVMLGVNQNMRYDQSVRACKDLLNKGILGKPVLATIDMRAIPHWTAWQSDMGWLTLRVMSIHHLDTFRYWLGDPRRVYCSVTQDPRTISKFPHEDGIAMYILEYENGMRASAWDDVWTGPVKPGVAQDIGINWRVEGLDGLAKGTIGWPSYPEHVPSTLIYTSTHTPGGWHQPEWTEAWFPDAFAGPMAQLLVALERNTGPEISGRDNLKTMALVDACYLSAREHRAVEIEEILRS
ncbi:oxidoreductase [Dyadobacter beijingensis]|uniref:Oxidoreductase n=1 Tax=Dyadobacter beijingensis TaxID=365489 RepID=A0ABQ2HU57_9BACT|nr:Gfo/Idh/MocA family oxidoreductase [Dyadobacter beijingensis]GGM90069.1 oxidoreductase [Dyadobacter beijingensis]